MLTYISYTTGSPFLGFTAQNSKLTRKRSAEIIAMIVFSFGPALLRLALYFYLAGVRRLYTLVFQQRYMGVLSSPPHLPFA